MANVRKALAYSFLGANTVTAIQFAATLIVARLLTPEELGVYSVAAVIIGVTSIMRDFGVSNYLVQTQELSSQILRSAFGVIILTASLSGFLVLITANMLADFYREPRLLGILYVLAINFLLTPLGSITLAIARRDMRFRALSAINVLSALVSVIVSIGLIMNDLGPIGLAWGAVAGTAATFIMSLWIRKSNSPLLPSLKKASEIVSFGIASATSNIFGYLNMTANDLVLGRLMNMEAVGLFNRGVSLTLFVTRAIANAIHPVLLPWLSELKRSNQHPRTAYRKVIEHTTGFTWPIFAITAVYSEEIVLVLFGDQWGQSAALVPYMCIAAAINSAYNVCSVLYLSVGKPSANVIATASNLPIKIGALIFLAPYGLMAVGAAWPWLAAVGAITHQILMKKYNGISLDDTFIGLRKSIMLGLAAFLSAGFVKETMEMVIPNLYLNLTLGVTFSTLAAFVVGIWVKHPLSEEISIFIKTQVQTVKKR